jgi:epoxyqueuosine reductase
MKSLDLEGSYKWKESIREFAAQVGFAASGFTDAKPIEGLEALLEKRKEAGYYTSFEEKEWLLRVNPKAVWESCKTVVVLAYPLPYTGKPEENEGIFARSAVGEDYHRVVTRAIEELIARMVNAGWNYSRPRFQVDTGSLNERAFAVRAGIGWVGRNQQLIIPQKGSFVSLALMLLDQKIPEDSPIENQCGACQKCIETCPAQIIGKNNFEANQCLSYLTQTKEVLSQEQVNRLGSRLFGCDTCQEACPHNYAWLQREAAEGSEIRRGADLWEVLELSKRDFNEKFKTTAAGWRGKGILQRNAYLALMKSEDPKLKSWEEAWKKDKHFTPIIKQYIKE